MKGPKNHLPLKWTNKQINPTLGDSGGLSKRYVETRCFLSYMNSLSYKDKDYG